MHRRILTLAPIAVLSLALFAAPAAASTHFVDASLASGANDGTSWANAFQGAGGLQSALAAAVAGDEIWVAGGTYLPSTTLVRTVAFDLKSGVAIRGGFAGGETLASQADPAVNACILQGDLAGDDGGGTVTDNSIHVVRGAQADATAILDGFTIEGGNANVAGADQDRGGGLLMTAGSNATIRRCIVRHNRCTFGGGAGYIRGSQPTFTDCRFEDNVGGSFGGAFDMANNGAASFERCVFAGNVAQRAGGVEIFASNSKLSNCLFFDNESQGAGGGGAIWIGSGSQPQIRNCTVVANRSVSNAVGGILVVGATLDLASSIVFDNSGPGGVVAPVAQIGAVGSANVRYCCVLGGFTGTGNTSGPPKFIDAANGDYRLRLGSPCVDAGDNTAVLPGVTLDLLGGSRFVDHAAAADVGAGSAPLVDMGAFETPPQSITPYCFGDGSEVACPCSNHSSVGSASGCANSSGAGGLLVGGGTPSLAVDSVVLSASSLTGVSALFVQGTRLAQIPIADGHSCINGALVRIGVFAVSGGAATYPTPLAAAGGVVAPGARFYQVHYRDGVGACAPLTTNRTNGVAVIWAP